MKSISPVGRYPSATLPLGVGQSERVLTTKIFLVLGGCAAILLVALLNVVVAEPPREESVHKYLEREGFNFVSQRSLSQHIVEEPQLVQNLDKGAGVLPEPEPLPEQNAGEEEEGGSSALDLSDATGGQEDLAINVMSDADTGPQRWALHYESGGLQGDIVGAEDFEIDEEAEAEAADTRISKVQAGFYRKRGDNIVFELAEIADNPKGPNGGRLMKFNHGGKQQDVELSPSGDKFTAAWPLWGKAPFRIASDFTGDLIEHDKFRFVRSPDGNAWPQRAKRPLSENVPQTISRGGGGGGASLSSSRPTTTRIANPKEVRANNGIDKPKQPGKNAWDWEKLHEGVEDLTTDPPEAPEELPTGAEVQEKIDSNPDMDPETKRKLQMLAVTEGMRSAWRAYVAHAWGADELKPFARSAHQWVGARRGTGISVVDSLGTLWLMGLRSDFEKAREWTNHGLDYNAANGVSHFEATIRYVGGLVSAYEMTGEKHPEFIKKAEELVDRLLAAYRGMSGIPKSQVNLRTRATSNWQWAKGGAVLAEFMTVQLEFRTLTLHSKEPLYDMRAQWVTDIIMDKCPSDRLCNTFYDLNNDRFFQGASTRVCLGAHGDSYFEYLLKQHLLTGRTQGEYREWWEESAINLLRKVALEIPGVALLLTEGRRGTDGKTFTKSHNMEHLACFAGGMYALGAAVYGDSKYRAEFISAAENLTDTCRMMYTAWPNKVGPEVAVIRQDGVASNVPHYLLRPEYVESLFIMWRVTKDQRYRDWGWDAYMGMFKNCRAPSGGFSGVKDVRTHPCRHDDVQQSFFLAETLKYLFLLFADDSLVPLDRWVFNTEAHPIKIRNRDPFSMWPEDMKGLRDEQMKESVDARTKLHRQGKAYVTAYESQLREAKVRQPFTDPGKK
eukprot:Hpha_TRINITY_DN12988_c0_g2::TRINITY_DN12988_c0_g2_i1::g.164247::m.164247/K01230/MAN1; mannosyl-oligosaccharide alpha-1,2-mannosidase